VQQIGSTQARANLSRLVDEVEKRGAWVEITHRGKVIAVIHPPGQDWPPDDLPVVDWLPPAPPGSFGTPEWRPLP